jgi:hypothetical protein
MTIDEAPPSSEPAATTGDVVPTSDQTEPELVATSGTDDPAASVEVQQWPTPSAPRGLRAPIQLDPCAPPPSTTAPVPPTSTTVPAPPTTTAPPPTTEAPLPSTTAPSPGSPRPPTVPGARLTRTVLASSANPSVEGQPVTFSVAVSAGDDAPIGLRRPGGSPAPSGGSVTISDGGTVLAVVAVVAGQAALTTSSLHAGTHTITAAFSGTSAAAPSSATIEQRVEPAEELPATR